MVWGIFSSPSIYGFGCAGPLAPCDDFLMMEEMAWTPMGYGNPAQLDSTYTQVGTPAAPAIPQSNLSKDFPPKFARKDKLKEHPLGYNLGHNFKKLEKKYPELVPMFEPWRSNPKVEFVVTRVQLEGAASGTMVDRIFLRESPEAGPKLPKVAGGGGGANGMTTAPEAPPGGTATLNFASTLGMMVVFDGALTKARVHHAVRGPVITGSYFLADFMSHMHTDYVQWKGLNAVNVQKAKLAALRGEEIPKWDTKWNVRKAMSSYKENLNATLDGMAAFRGRVALTSAGLYYLFGVKDPFWNQVGALSLNLAPEMASLVGLNLSLTFKEGSQVAKFAATGAKAVKVIGWVLLIDDALGIIEDIYNAFQEDEPGFRYKQGFKQEVYQEHLGGFFSGFTLVRWGMNIFVDVDAEVEAKIKKHRIEEWVPFVEGTEDTMGVSDRVVDMMLQFAIEGSEEARAMMVPGYGFDPAMDTDGSGDYNALFDRMGGVDPGYFTNEEGAILARGDPGGDFEGPLGGSMEPGSDFDHATNKSMNRMSYLASFSKPSDDELLYLAAYALGKSDLSEEDFKNLSKEDAEKIIKVWEDRTKNSKFSEEDLARAGVIGLASAHDDFPAVWKDSSEMDWDGDGCVDNGFAEMDCKNNRALAKEAFERIVQMNVEARLIQLHKGQFDEKDRGRFHNAHELLPFLKGHAPKWEKVAATLDEYGLFRGDYQSRTYLSDYEKTKEFIKVPVKQKCDDAADHFTAEFVELAKETYEEGKGSFDLEVFEEKVQAAYQSPEAEGQVKVFYNLLALDAMNGSLSPKGQKIRQMIDEKGNIIDREGLMVFLMKNVRNEQQETEREYNLAADRTGARKINKNSVTGTTDVAWNPEEGAVGGSGFILDDNLTLYGLYGAIAHEFGGVVGPLSDEAIDEKVDAAIQADKAVQGNVTTVKVFYPDLQEPVVYQFDDNTEETPFDKRERVSVLGKYRSKLVKYGRDLEGKTPTKIQIVEEQKDLDGTSSGFFQFVLTPENGDTWTQSVNVLLNNPDTAPAVASL